LSAQVSVIIGYALVLGLFAVYAVSLLVRLRRAGAGGERVAARPSAPRPSGRRLTGWRAGVALAGFVLVASVALLGLIEGAFRVAGYGGYATTFQRYGRISGGADLVITDYTGPSTYFFADRSRPGSLARDALLMPKPPGTFRVILAGGSAAKGFPYGRNLAASSFLEAMLTDLMPGTRVEVINIGTTAIASYPVLGMVTESLLVDPDLVIVYCGNNEFYGAYGVASLHSAGRSPASIRFTRFARGLGVTQFIESRRTRQARDEGETLMEAMMGRASIDPADAMRADAARNLGVFVGEMIERCGAAGVPVIVCTPPGNERGLAPLGESDLSGLSEADRATVLARLAEGESLLGSDPGGAVSAARGAISLAPLDAGAHFLLARALEARGEEAEAARAYQRAMDLDPMPWRAPTASLEAIRSAALSHGATLCDLVEIFREQSPGGSIGWELMDDHVHPSLAGQGLIARSLAVAIPRAVPSVGYSPSAVDGLADTHGYAMSLGLTPYDLYAVGHAMRVLGSIGFFERTNPQYRERFESLCREIESTSTAEVIGALRAWQEAPSEGGERRPVNAIVAQAMFDSGRYAEADPLYFSALASVAPYGTWELQYAAFGLTSRGASRGSLSAEDRALAAEMIGRGRFLIDRGFSKSGAAERYVGDLLLLRDEPAEAVPVLLSAREKLGDEGRVAVDGLLVKAYARLGRRADAEGVIRAGLQSGGPYARYYEQMRATLP
jgi:tetratricopeptide (TPR) repeat protein